MNAKQLQNILALARMGLTVVSTEPKYGPEHLHEWSGDVVAGGKKLAEMQAEEAKADEAKP